MSITVLNSKLLDNTKGEEKGHDKQKEETVTVTTIMVRKKEKTAIWPKNFAKGLQKPAILAKSGIEKLKQIFSYFNCDNFDNFFKEVSWNSVLIAYWNFI